jgi:5-hydroxyisourate hydrolase-like protein (transthyretin family)
MEALQMSASLKSQFVATLLTAALLAWACGPASAAVHIEGQVQGGGEPIANSTVTLWEASAGASKQLAQTKTDSDGRFEVRSEEPATTRSFISSQQEASEG